MRIDVRHSSRIPGAGLVDLATRRLAFALDRFASRVFSVRLFLHDTNGPRGGSDLRCRLIARVRGVPDVVIEDTDEKLESLLARIADRLSYTIGRRLERRRSGQKRLGFAGT